MKFQLPNELQGKTITNIAHVRDVVTSAVTSPRFYDLSLSSSQLQTFISACLGGAGKSEIAKALDALKSIGNRNLLLLFLRAYLSPDHHSSFASLVPSDRRTAAGHTD